MTETESVIIQVRNAHADTDWTDYSRCTPAEAARFLKSHRLTPDGREYRAVDWISHKPVELSEPPVMRDPWAGA